MLESDRSSRHDSAIDVEIVDEQAVAREIAAEVARGDAGEVQEGALRLGDAARAVDRDADARLGGSRASTRFASP